MCGRTLIRAECHDKEYIYQLIDVYWLQLHLHNRLCCWRSGYIQICCVGGKRAKLSSLNKHGRRAQEELCGKFLDLYQSVEEGSKGLLMQTMLRTVLT